MHHAKNCGNKEIPLAIVSRILPQSCVTPPYIIETKGLHMIVLISLIVMLGGFHDFSHGTSHPYILILNDVWTCTNFHCYNCYYGPVIGIFVDSLPKSMCYCLQTCNVDVALFVIHCMCIPGFVIASAGISQ